MGNTAIEPTIKTVSEWHKKTFTGTLRQSGFAIGATRTDIRFSCPEGSGNSISADNWIFRIQAMK
jgi:hypothetical protein